MTADFTPSPHAAFAEAFQAHVDERMEMRAMEQEPRDYLGGSRLGVECERALGYEYTTTPKDEGRHFAGKTLRIFDMGHDGEERMAAYLYAAGFTLVTARPDGQQIGFWIAKHPETGRARIAGHIDGVVTDGPDEIGGVALRYPMLWENKALNDKGYSGLMKRGLKREKVVYYVQMQTYQAYLDLAENPGLFTALNRNTGDLYAELVPFDAADAQAASDKGVRVISAASPEELPRIGCDETDHRCRWCDWKGRCWSRAETPAQPAVAPSWMQGVG